MKPAHMDTKQDKARGLKARFKEDREGQHQRRHRRQTAFGPILLRRRQPLKPEHRNGIRPRDWDEPQTLAYTQDARIASNWAGAAQLVSLPGVAN